MNEVVALGMRWLRLESLAVGGAARSGGHGDLSLRVACPHCTNVDTLSRHCRNATCLWVRCTCGALVYTRRRHRHPRHGSSQDTCHDRSAAV